MQVDADEVQHFLKVKPVCFVTLKQNGFRVARFAGLHLSGWCPVRLVYSWCADRHGTQVLRYTSLLVPHWDWCGVFRDKVSVPINNIIINETNIQVDQFCTSSEPCLSGWAVMFALPTPSLVDICAGALLKRLSHSHFLVDPPSDSIRQMEVDL